jgi:hypothetical protein
MGKRTVLSVGDKKRHVPTKNILLQARKILPTICPFHGVKPCGSTVLQIFSEKKKNGRMRGSKPKTA